MEATKSIETVVSSNIESKRQELTVCEIIFTAYLYLFYLYSCRVYFAGFGAYVSGLKRMLAWNQFQGGPQSGCQN